ncbi:MAG TPA: hypothetical protein VHE81_20170 [Lacipirellulaceae bacterium]|nr:hypothetical protein [Lacipirellulaceae bacterium]
MPALFIDADSVREHLTNPNDVVPQRITSRMARQMFEVLIAAGATFAEPSSLPAVLAGDFSLEFTLPNGVRVLYTEGEVANAEISCLEARYGLVLASGRCFAMFGDGLVADTLQVFAGMSGDEESDRNTSGFEYLKVLAAALHHG